jgi:hypothetical protein
VDKYKLLVVQWARTKNTNPKINMSDHIKPVKIGVDYEFTKGMRYRFGDWTVITHVYDPRRGASPFVRRTAKPYTVWRAFNSKLQKDGYGGIRNAVKELSKYVEQT